MTPTDCPVKHNPISFYLMCSYAYYMLDESFITDHEFDTLARWLLKNYDSIEHQHKHLISKDSLKAGTYLGEYPDIVVIATFIYQERMLGNNSTQGNENE